VTERLGVCDNAWMTLGDSGMTLTGHGIMAWRRRGGIQSMKSDGIAQRLVGYSV